MLRFKFCYIQWSKLTYLKFSFIRYIEKNPLNCTCALEQLMIFMQTSGMLAYNSRNDLLCSSPRHVRKVDIIEVPFDNLECDTVYGKYYTCNLSIHTFPSYRNRQYDKIFNLVSFKYNIFTPKDIRSVVNC